MSCPIDPHHSERTGGPDEASLKRLWQIKRTNNSIWLVRKQRAVPPLPFPILPRLLEMDINEGRRKARKTLQDRYRKPTSTVDQAHVMS